MSCMRLEKKKQKKIVGEDSRSQEKLMWKEALSWAMKDGGLGLEEGRWSWRCPWSCQASQMGRFEMWRKCTPPLWPGRHSPPENSAVLCNLLGACSGRGHLSKSAIWDLARRIHLPPLSSLSLYFPPILGAASPAFSFHKAMRKGHILK